MNDTTRLKAFARMVQAMRRVQKRYFNDRSSQDLATSKELERIIDRTVDEVLAPPDLFERETAHREGNEVAMFSGVTETIRTLIKSGQINLAAFPKLEQRIEACHQLLREKELIAQANRERSA